jgi:hypothetical protein
MVPHECPIVGLTGSGMKFCVAGRLAAPTPAKCTRITFLSSGMQPHFWLTIRFLTGLDGHGRNPCASWWRFAGRRCRGVSQPFSV